MYLLFLKKAMAIKYPIDCLLALREGTLQSNSMNLLEVSVCDIDSMWNIRCCCKLNYNIKSFIPGSCTFTTSSFPCFT